MKKHVLILLISGFIFSTGNSQTITSVGTDFWVAFPPNYNSITALTLFISSNFTTSGNVTSAYPGVNQSFTVIPGVVTQVSIPSGAALQDSIEDKGIEITSADPVSVYGLNYLIHTTDAFLALPVNALGLDYRIVSYPNFLDIYGSCFSIVATQDGTSLTILNSQSHLTSNININKGQTYHVNSKAQGDDFTGSRVQSNFPVAVFGADEACFLPTQCGAADYIVEEMFPYYSWGKNFLTVQLAGRNPSGDFFRLVTADDGTDISINGTYVTTINTGQHYDTTLAGSNSFTSSKPIIMVQDARGFACSGSPGDPFMMLIPPREQFLTSYTVVTVTGFISHWVNVVAPHNALGTIYQDGSLIPDAAFTQIGTTGYIGAQRSVTQGSHTFNSTIPFGVFVYGWNSADSYGYPGGCSLSPVGTVNSVTLSPDTAYGQLNVTNVCLTANVLDNLANPVAGVLVNFNVLGINPLTGTGYTDASGNVQYCYTQTGAAACEDHIYAEVFGVTSDTSVVFWTYTPPCNDPANGGTIGNDQSGCGSYIPTTLNNIQLPSGYTGTLEFKWQISTTGSTSGFTDIAASNSSSYNPGSVTQTTWFKRLARVDCMTDWSGAVESNVVQITVVPPLLVNVSISATANIVCAGTQVTFTATPTNGGANPFFQWKINGINTGGNNPVLLFTPLNGDCITCILTSNLPCTTGNPATSNTICMTVNPNLPLTISINASANPVCEGSQVTFAAAIMNGGPTPSYQWKVNGANVGSNLPTYAYNPASGDLVSCILTSNAICPIGNPATSNTIGMTVNPNLPVSISITASNNPVCAGIPVTFNSATINGGTTPVYHWKVNGINIGPNNSTYQYTPAIGDIVTCVLTSNLPCPLGNPAISNIIGMNISALPVVTFTRCNDSITTTTAQPFKLKGGIPLGGTYSGAGVTGGIFNPAIAGVGPHQIMYTYTNAALCAANAIVTIVTIVTPVTTCGQPITDIRDGKTYQTVHIGNQCWLAEDLNYGTEISSNIDQRDNCTPEKYHNPASSIQHPASVYQWDEIMSYDESVSTQGLCPPSWHVPTEADWTTLFKNYINDGFAASPLKYSGFSGFNALLNGALHLNKNWDYPGFATFFWSSTAHGTDKAWSHGMNDPDPSVSAYPGFRSNAFSVRCIKDN